MYICDLFYDTDNLHKTSYASDNTPYTFSPEIDAFTT